ncbi:hypothetical protein L6R53_09470 [Myxococcota bacterium]|nr:hypothetical protein [Myxococcota bacterium]
MPRLPWPLLALLLLACPGSDKDPADSGGGTADGGVDGGGDGGGTTGDGGGTADGGGTTGDGGGTADGGGTTGDGGGDGGGEGDGGTPWVVYDTVQATDLAWAADEDVGSVLRVQWSQLSPAHAWVEFSSDGATWSASPRVVVETGAAAALVLGLPYDTALTLRVVNDFGEGPLFTDPVEARTGPLPEGAPTAWVSAAETSGWDPTLRYLWTSVRGLGQTWLVIVDRQGDLVWVRPQPDSIQTYWTSVTRAGDALLWDDTDFFGDDDRVVEAAIDGTVLHTYDTPHLHHAFAELEDGAIAWQAWPDDGVETIEQVDLDGSTQRLFEAPEGWHTNALWWDEASDSLLSSYYSHHSIQQIDRPTGEVLATWGQEGDWTFSPSDSRFWFQHGVSLTADGTLLLSCHIAEDSDEAVVREYRLDEAGAALEQVWTVGAGEGIEAAYYGEALRLPGGNTLRNYGSNARVREVDPTGAVVWELEWRDALGDPAALVGHMAPLEDLYALAP